MGSDAAGALRSESGELVALERHRHDVLSRISPLEPIELGLLDALGCVLAADIAAATDLPAFANSAMDGYAVRAGDAHPGSQLRVIGESAAGTAQAPDVTEGSAVRIMTGALLPDGAEAVVPVELADEADGVVQLRAGAPAGQHVRPAGGDVRAGTVVLHAGRRLGAADIGMLAAVGRERVRVHPRPRVAVVATGDELAEPGAPLNPGQIRDANSYTLTAAAREAGATAFRQPIARDDWRALTAAFEGVLASADVLVTSGGVSAGRYDLVKRVLAEMGDVEFRRVGMQPGMPQAFGFVDRESGRPVPCFGLPGNPVSALVSFEVFVRPALRRMQGRSDLNRPRVRAVLGEDVRSPSGKVSFLRVRLEHHGEDWVAVPTGAQGSGILSSVVAADGLAEVPADRTELAAGHTVLVHLLVGQP